MVYKIDTNLFELDIQATKEYYLKQPPIIECGCDDCLYFVNTISQMPLRVFKIISDMGVDVCKNEHSENGGLSSVEISADNLLYIHSYTIQGHINSKTDDKGEIHFSEIEESCYAKYFFKKKSENSFSCVINIEIINKGTNSKPD
jgi:hypothetical protein